MNSMSLRTGFRYAFTAFCGTTRSKADYHIERLHHANLIQAVSFHNWVMIIATYAYL